VIGGKCEANCATEMADPTAVQMISVATGTTAVLESRAKLTHVRYGHTATRLTEELGAAVLVAGGRDPVTNEPVKQAELFKPLAEAFSMQFTAEMRYPRWGHQAVRLPDGSVLFVGGLTRQLNTTTMQLETVVADRMELFSPLDATFVDVGPLPPTAGRLGMSATVLPDGRVLITGGQITVGGPAVDSAFIANLDPVNGEVRVVPTDRLAVPRMNHQATPLCDGTVLISGGVDGQASYERYNPVAIGRR
jgi:hypothetical protein